MKKAFTFIITLILILVIPVVALSHRGRTDDSGGHYDRIHGGYHYHHGYSAHDHPNGKCPYNSKYNDYDEYEDDDDDIIATTTTTTTTAHYNDDTSDDDEDIYDDNQKAHRIYKSEKDDLIALGYRIYSVAASIIILIMLVAVIKFHKNGTQMEEHLHSLEIEKNDYRNEIYELRNKMNNGRKKE